jgi:hypothetical protein
MPDVKEAGKRALAFLSRIDPVMFKEMSTNYKGGHADSSRKTWGIIASATDMGARKR